jgi:hypothetical protein
MKKVIAVLGALLVGSAVYAAAAALNVSAVTLGEGTSTVTSCTDVTTLGASFNTSYNATAGEFVVDSVTVSNIPDECDGLDMDIVLANASNTSIGAGSATVVAPSDGSSQTVSVSPTPVSSAVTRTVIQITG